MTLPRLDLSRDQILAFRRMVGALDERLSAGADSLRRAAWAGLQDSMPRAALLSIHARVRDVPSSILDDPSLVQLWGPRYSAYVVAEPDRAVFTLGRLPDAPRDRAFAEETANLIDDFLDGRRLTYGEVGRGLGVHPNRLRYGAPTGRVLIRWDGARQPTVWTVPRPAVEADDARLELARRYLHVFGPATAEAFADWAHLPPRRARTTFEELDDELTPVRTPIGDAWILASDEPTVRAPAGPPAAARLLPSGDAYYLLQGRDRELLVPDAGRRGELWTPRVWPGAVLVAGEVVGVWRRAGSQLTIQPWQPLAAEARDAVEREAASLPLPGIRELRIRWEG